MRIDAIRDTRIGRLLLRWPAVLVASLAVMYLLLGYWAVPALLKWQLPAQVQERLGHRLTIGELRFDPLRWRLQADGVALTGPDGRPRLAFDRFVADLELRGLVDRAWTLAELTLDAPVLHFERDVAGRHNLADLLERLAGGEPAPPEGEPARFVVERLSLNAGRIEWRDRILANDLVARVEPLQLDVEGLSNVPGRTAPYRVAARSAAGETIEARGALALAPVKLQGTLSIRGLQVATLARALSRQVALGAPAGTIHFGADLDLAVDAAGTLGGSVRDVAFSIDALSLRTPGADAASGEPRLALKRVSLTKGQVALDRRAAEFASLQVADGSVRAAVDAQGRLDWTQWVRTPEPVRPARTVAPGAATAGTAGRVASSASLASSASAVSSAASAATAARSASTPPAVPASAPASASAPSGAMTARASATAEAAPWRVAVAELGVRGVALAFTDAHAGRDASIERLDLSTALQATLAQRGARAELGPTRVTAVGLRLRQGGEPPSGGLAMALRSLSVDAGRAVLDAAAPALNATVDAPKLSAGEVSLELATSEAMSLRLQDATWGARELALRTQPERLEVGLAQPRGEITTLALRHGAGRVDLAAASLAGGELSVVQSAAGLELGAAALKLAIRGLDARRKADRLAVQQAEAGAKALAVSAGAAAPRPPAPAAPTASPAPVGAPAAVAGARIRLDDATLRLAALDLAALGARTSLATLGGADLGAKSLTIGGAARPGSTAVDVRGDGLRAALDGAVVRSPVDATELLSIGRARLADGTVRVNDRSLRAERLTLTDATVRTWLDAQGRLNWASAFGRDTAAEGASGGSTPPHAAPPATAVGTPWRVALTSVEVDGASVDFEDRRESPAFALGLEALQVSAGPLDTGAKAAVPLRLQGRVASGGDIGLEGSVRPDTGAADLALKIDALALAPAQPVLSKVARLKIGSGTASAAGRLRYGDPATAGARLTYAGSVEVDAFSLLEERPERPFLSWKSVASRDLELTIEPDGLDIGELRVDGPTGRLIIAEDQSVNLKAILKPTAPKAEPARSAAQPGRDDAEQATFPVRVARIRVSGGEMEFADLSLRPQFGTRMHDLGGVVSGLGTDPTTPADIRLDAQVDEFGSARIRGRLSAMRPEELTEVDLVFRNLEMRSLSPYVVKFAGYRVKSGRLALDLRYKVRQGKLLGENQAVLEQMELGEKVDSPGALDLPLELAVAILKDSRGVIDIAVPVSGDLRSPQFDYAAVIGKAIAGVLGGIVTAPFRALGALFGAAGEALDVVRFEPGSAALAPPERHQLQTVARALADRPSLRLVVPPTADAARDGAALRSRAVREDVARRVGATLAPGEDPGPLDVASVRVQRAIEDAFVQRYAREVLDALKGREVPSASDSGAAATPPRPGASAPAPVLPPAFFGQLLRKMIDEEPVADPAIEALGAERSAAIVRELTVANGVEARRVALGPARAAEREEAETVPLRLSLEAAP